MTRKAALEPDEVLRVAYAHLVNNVDQHVLASLMGVNPGRVNEACKAIEWAMSNHMQLYRQITNQNNEANRAAQP